MILQLSAVLSSVFGGAPGSSLLSTLGGIASRGITALTPVALGIGEQFATGLLNRELTRGARNDLDDAIKAQLRAAANAVSPTVAPGQTAVFSGGPAIGSAFAPATLLPPSIQPPQRILQTNPNFFPRSSAATFQRTRRPPDLFRDLTPEEERALQFPTQAGVGGAMSSAIRGGVEFLRSFGVSGSRALQGVGIGAVAAETAAIGAGLLLNPSTAFAPGLNGGFPTSGDALRITEAQIRRSQAMPQVVTTTPTGLPARGNFQREANGCQVQWYFWDGSNSPQPIDRGQAACLKRDCIFRLNVFTGKFVKLKGRRMNPMNVRAFFRAGRRVDSGERICRKMFSEHRKTKTGTIRRKRSRKKK